MAIIEIKSLSKIFGNDPSRALHLLDLGWSKEKIAKEAKQTVGVNRVNLSIESGEIFVIMGLSGSGKSTLVRLLNRLIEPTAGQILINDQDITRMNAVELRQLRRRTMSMVFQKFALFPHRTILENVEYGLEVQGIGKSERRKKAIKTLELVGLAGLDDRRPDELSGGMQQRVGLARGLANDPEILLMDEAFSALDPLIRKDMQDELLELQATVQKTIIFITHDLDEALRIGDRIALMKDGAVVQIGTPEQILTHPANAYVEKFVEDVDLSKVLTAAHVMIRAETVTMDRGPRVALQIMQDHGISTLYVIDKSRRLIGVVTAEDAAAAIKAGQTIEDIILREIPTVSPEVLLAELFEVASSAKIPVAVIDERQRLVGIIIKSAILGALSGNSRPEAGGSREHT